MMRRFKKLITVLLVAAMVLTPVMSVYAEGSEEVAEAIEEVAEELEEAVEPAEGGETEEIAKPAEEIEEAIEPAEEIEEAVGEVEEEAVGETTWTDPTEPVVTLKTILGTDCVQTEEATASITYESISGDDNGKMPYNETTYYGLNEDEYSFNGNPAPATISNANKTYKFYGWFKDNELVNDGKNILKVNANESKEIVTEWTGIINKVPKTKTIYRYDDLGGTEFEARYVLEENFATVSFVDIRTKGTCNYAQSIVKGEKAIKGAAQANLKKSGNAPVAYYSDPDGDSEYSWKAIEGNTTIYVQFGCDIKVIYDYANDTDSTILATSSYEWMTKGDENDFTPMMAPTTISEYQFLYWETDSTGYKVFDQQIKGNSYAYNTTEKAYANIQYPLLSRANLQLNRDRTFTAVYTDKKWVSFETGTNEKGETVTPESLSYLGKKHLIEKDATIESILTEDPVDRSKLNTFKGWCTDLSDKEGSKWETDTPITENIILHPVWETKAKIELFISGQTIPYDTIYTDKHATMSEPSKEYKRDKRYVVDRFCKDINLTKEFDFNTIISEDTKLYAMLKINTDAETVFQYKATEGGSVSIDSEVVSTIVNEAGTKLAKGSEAKAASGYRFLYWMDEAGIVYNDKVLVLNRVENPDNYDDLGRRYSTYEYRTDKIYTAYFELIPAPAPTPSGGGGGTVKSAQPAGTVQGNWAYNAATDKWTFASNDGRTYHNEWANVYNPYATGTQPKASWYFFDANNIMLTGYQWIPSLAGGYRLFYLHESNDGDRGRMYVNEATPNGGFADANGWVSINGVLQVK